MMLGGLGIGIAGTAYLMSNKKTKDKANALISNMMDETCNKLKSK